MIVLILKSIMEKYMDPVNIFFLKKNYFLQVEVQEQV